MSPFHLYPGNQKKREKHMQIKDDALPSVKRKMTKM